MCLEYHHKICNKSGTELISTAGHSLDAKYFDARDDSGNPNIYSFFERLIFISFSSFPQLSVYDVVKPLSGNVEEIVLSGSIKNHKSGVPLDVTITYPDGTISKFCIYSYK